MKSLLSLAVLCVIALDMQAHAAQPYTLAATEVIDLRAVKLQRDYQLLVALPDSYADSNRRYPVLFVTDTDYAFPIVRNIAQRLSKHAGLEEVIVVGLSYAQGDSGVHSRRRDYTPSVPGRAKYAADMPGRAPVFGEAAGYAGFIVSEVFPLIAKQYRADMRRKVFIGHSYGSLLGLGFMLAPAPSFEHYILGSPSLWFDDGVMFAREHAYASTHRDLPASVFFGIGATETLSKGAKQSRSEDDADMLGDMRAFDQALKSHHYPNLRTQLKIFEDEDHASVFPMVLTHGLRAYLKKIH